MPDRPPSRQRYIDTILHGKYLILTLPISMRFFHNVAQQFGQISCSNNHAIRHMKWKTCEHGVFVTCSDLSNSFKQIEQTGSSPVDNERIFNIQPGFDIMILSNVFNQSCNEIVLFNCSSRCSWRLFTFMLMKMLLAMNWANQAEARIALRLLVLF